MGRFSNIIQEYTTPKYVDTEFPDGGYKREYCVTGVIVYYDKNYQLHRLDGPALYDPVRGYEEWYMHGKKHNTKGLAQRVWKKGHPMADAYYVNGHPLSKEEFEKHFGDDK